MTCMALFSLLILSGAALAAGMRRPTPEPRPARLLDPYQPTLRR